MFWAMSVNGREALPRPIPALRRRKEKLMLAHANSGAAKRDPLICQTQPLLQREMSAQANLAASAYNAVPGNSASGGVQRPGDLAGRAGKTRRARHLAVGRNLALRYSADRSAQRWKHGIPSDCNLGY